MAPVTGWYPDPAGQAEFRFWDGENWTTATAPPAAQQYSPQQYTPQQYTPQQAAYQPRLGEPAGYGGFQRAPEPRRSKRLYSIAGAVAAAVAIAAVGVPLGLGAGGTAKHPTTAALKAALLSADQVGAIAQGTFRIDNSAGSSDNNSSDSDCTSLPNQSGADKATKAEADTGYADSVDGLFVAEDLAYTPAKAAGLFRQLKSQVGSCHTIVSDGTSFQVTLLPPPSVSGSDDSLAFQTQGVTSGTHVVIDFAIARFGDTVVSIVSGGRGDAATESVVTPELLRQAAAQAKSVL